MTYYTYMLECIAKRGKKSIYTGYTGCMTSRFDAHVDGRGARYTKGKKLRVIWTQAFRTQAEAMRREREVKNMTRKKKLALVAQVIK